jgi:hypothetical protein
MKHEGPLEGAFVLFRIFAGGEVSEAEREAMAMDDVRYFSHK